MSKPLSTGVRVSILLIVAVLFAATMIALSVRDKEGAVSQKSGLFSDDKKITQKYNVEPGGTLVVDSDVGSVSIIGTGNPEVSIVIYARGSEDELDRFDVKTDQEGDNVIIRARYSHKNFRWLNSNWLNVSIEVEVPKKYKLDLRTAGGNIEIENIEGSIEGETSGGNLTLEDLKGDVKLSTSGGNVKLRHASGEFRLETSGGYMSAQDVAGPLHMETSGGNIDIRDCEGEVYASTSGGSVRASLKSNQGIDLSTSGGNIDVHIPSTVLADIRAETSGGDVSCELEFSGKLKEGSLNGKINGGGNLIRLDTSGGDITIYSLD